MSKKGNRVVICADVSFPEGDPGAHRIQYVAKSLQHGGKQVIIFSHGKRCANKSVQYYDDIPYFNYNIRNKLNLHTGKILGGIEFIKLLKRFHVISEDIVYIYGNNALVIEPIFLFCKIKRIKMYIDVVEWHQPYQYKYGKIDPRYLFLNHTFARIAPSIKNIVAISTVIQNYYLERKCNVFILPPMTNIDERIVFPVCREDNVKNIIYPGNPITKDDVVVMLAALNGLTAEQRNGIRMHFTGVSEKKIRCFLNDREELLDNIKNCVIFHGFLEYTELEKLYSITDFLLLPRYDNLVTRANFPSKVPELMKWGIIPICNKIGDYYTYLQDGIDAIMFDEDTSEHCQEAIVRAISLEQCEIEGMRKNAQKCVRDKFDYRIWSEKLNNFVFKG